MSAQQRGPYFIYILSNPTRRLYVGMTNDLERRIHQHKNKLIDGHTSKYNITWLVYFEETGDVRAALEREKQVKRWRREKKVALIESMNPRWIDLAQDWYQNSH